MTRSPASPPNLWLDRLLLTLAGMAAFLPALGRRDLWNPNEPIYGRAVVELVQRSAWLLPSVNGEPFAEKPILYFWLARLVSWLRGGVDELALRLPSALAAIVGLWLVYGLVGRDGSRLRAGVAAAMFGTMVSVAWSARSIQMDLLLTVAVLATICAMTWALDSPTGDRWKAALAGGTAAFGVLAKGPLGLILPVSIVAVSRFRRRGSTRDDGRMLGIAMVTFVLLAAPWPLALLAGGHSDALMEMFGNQNFGRFFSAWDHQQPWWYYLAYFWVDMAPWSLFVPLAVAGTLGCKRELDRLALIWILIPLLLFSLSASKRSAYLLPVAPAVAILASAVVERLPRPGVERFRRRLVGCVTQLHGWLLLLLAPAAIWLVVPRYPLLATAAHGLSLVLLAGAVVLLWVGRRTQTAALRPIVALAATLCVLQLYLAVAALPAFDRYKSPRRFCTQMVEIVGDAPLQAYRPWKWRAGYVYYADRKIPRLTSPEALRRYWNVADERFVLVERGKRAEFLRIVGDRRPRLFARVGSGEAALYSNRLVE